MIDPEYPNGAADKEGLYLDALHRNAGAAFAFIARRSWCRFFGKSR